MAEYILTSRKNGKKGLSRMTITVGFLVFPGIQLEDRFR
jgi:hypothetical protein